jgi:hypothetical protein
MTLPNFLIIGAAKSGTTALYEYLNQHPDIFLSEVKELRFFSYTNENTSHVPEIYLHKGVTTIEEYIKHFEDVKDETIIGEASPMYLYTPGTAERIKSTIPNAKLLAILRNPVDRAFSAYSHAIREWKEPALSFREGLDLENDRIAQGWGMLWHYINAGYYYKQLKPYYDTFNKEQLKITLYDDLVSDGQKLIKEIFIFLGVDPDFIPDISHKPNVSGFPKSEGLHQLMGFLSEKKNPFRWISRKLLPRSIRKKAIEEIREKNLQKHKLDPELRHELREVFYEDIKNLENLIQRDLSSWLSDC